MAMKPEGHTETTQAERDMAGVLRATLAENRALQQANERMREVLEMVVSQFEGVIETRNDQDAIDEARAALADARTEEKHDSEQQ